jgi:DNA-directed RNA polymerase subunit RPC12/RpoP
VGLFDNMINTMVHRASGEFGRAVGNAAGSVVEQAADNYTNDMKRQYDEKHKEINIPQRCPYCNAPTSDKIVCEYCGTKMVTD